jgi:hypothetical protein
MHYSRLKAFRYHLLAFCSLCSPEHCVMVWDAWICYSASQTSTPALLKQAQCVLLAPSGITGVDLVVLKQV